MKRFGRLFIFGVFSSFFLLSINTSISGYASLSNKNPTQYPEIAPNSALTFNSKFNGKVIVIDDGEYRSLIFGSENSRAIQSKVYLKNHAKLVFNYAEC